ncbi:MAG: SOS response-associated peptidase [Bacteroidales bacterium]
MCFYFRQSKEALSIANRFKIKIKDNEPIIKSEIINGFTNPVCQIITNNEPEKLSYFNWGLLPEGSDRSIMKYTLNGRVETIHEKRSFSNVVNNRCLVIADGFYEWKETIINSKKSKQKFLFTIADEELFSFAGLYSHWYDFSNNTDYKTFTILTTVANDVVASVHSKGRMPVILKKEDESDYLNGFDLVKYSYPYSLNLNAIPLNINKEGAQNLLF